MRKRSAIGTAVVALAAALLPSLNAAGETSTFVTPVAYGTHLPGLGKPALSLARALKERSEGAIVLDLKEPGHGTAPHEILDKVSDGKVDAGFATAGFWAAKLPAAPLFGGFPFGPDASGYLAWFERGNGRALYQEMYDQAKLKVHVIPCGFGGAEAGLWSTKEIKQTKDIDGLRVRIFGLGARVMSRLGAVPALIAGGQLPEAFKKGQVAAAELYTPAIDRAQGLQGSVKRIYSPGWHQPATVLEFLVNKDRWETLTEDQRHLVEETCRDILRSTRVESATLQSAALKSLSAQDDVQIVPLPDDVLGDLRAAWGEVAREEGTRDFFFKEVLEDIKRFEAVEAPQQRTSPEGSVPASEDSPQDAAEPGQ